MLSSAGEQHAKFSADRRTQCALLETGIYLHNVQICSIPSVNLFSLTNYRKVQAAVVHNVPKMEHTVRCHASRFFSKICVFLFSHFSLDFIMYTFWISTQPLQNQYFFFYVSYLCSTKFLKKHSLR